MSRRIIYVQVINDSGTQVVDTWAFNAEDLSVSSLFIVCEIETAMVSVRTLFSIPSALTGVDEHGTHKSGYFAAYTACRRQAFDQQAEADPDSHGGYLRCA